jgi:hypothetical protein
MVTRPRLTCASAVRNFCAIGTFANVAPIAAGGMWYPYPLESSAAPELAVPCRLARLSVSVTADDGPPCSEQLTTSSRGLHPHPKALIAPTPPACDQLVRTPHAEEVERGRRGRRLAEKIGARPSPALRACAATPIVAPSLPAGPDVFLSDE